MKRIAFLLPPLSTLHASPDLDRCLARADRLRALPAGEVPTLQRFFVVHPPLIAAAALTREADVGDARGAQWLRADPAYVRADMVAGRMLACGELGLGDDDSAELARKLKPLFGDFGYEFSAPNAARWYVRLPREAKLPRFAPPEDALGDDLHSHLPSGEGAARWIALLNETQVLLHNHPLNASREARGAVPVNSVWFWGGGALPDNVRSEMIMRAVSADRVLAGLARLCGVDVSEAIDPEQSAFPLAGALVDLRHPNDPKLIEAWIARSLAALRSREIGAIDLACIDGHGFQYQRRHRWRLWRRPVLPA